MIGRRPLARLLACLLLILSFAVALMGASCGPTDNPQLPDPKYVYSPSGTPLPPGATEVSQDDFAKGYSDGTIILAGPQAEAEVAAREKAQDDADRSTIDDYQRANPNAGPILPDLVLPSDGSVTPYGDNLQIKVVKPNSRVPSTYLTMGQRFRLRTVARSIRNFPTKDNQLAMYTKFYDSLNSDYRQRLQLPTTDEAAKLDAPAILALNNKIAANWQSILGSIQVFTPVLPPSCDGDEGKGNGTDRSGDSSGCGYKDGGLMKNYNWSGKEHISCVKDQAARGTCPSFSTVSTMEYSVHEKYGRRVNLSEQALYARMKLVWGNGQTYGDGYWPNDGFNSSFAEGFLVPFENQWDYNPSSSRNNVMAAGADGILGTDDDVLVNYTHSCDGYSEACSDTTHQTQLVCVAVPFLGNFCGYLYPDVNPSNEGFRVASGTIDYWDPANRDLSMAKMILAVGLFRAQVVWGFDVQTSSWSPDANGFVHFASATENAKIGGHAVHAVGLISNSELSQLLPNAPQGSGGGYFIIKNSWSNCWGDGGFVYVPFDSVRAYSLQMVSAPSVQ